MSHKPVLSMDERIVNYKGVSLCWMVIWNLNQHLLRHLFAMDMTVRLVVIDAQYLITARKRAFPALSRNP